jgi:hypothetical protein
MRNLFGELISQAEAEARDPLLFTVDKESQKE